MANNDIITNISYLNKDFRTIYEELLNYVKVLTNKWDPSLSNESDPGVILIKLLAILGDKNNYNIDKNILEAFPSSVTQYGNARKIFDLCGYKMHWYESSQVEVTFSSDDDSLEDVSIPAWTMITDNNGSVVYTLYDQPGMKIYPKGVAFTLAAIEGRNKQYTINGLTSIQLNNLDDNLRLYFEETQIAENGIYINNVGSSGDYWTPVDNLASYPLSRKVFTFGVLPNSNTCYIQFPQDVLNLIGDGLEIRYIISSGEAGKIKAATLTNFLEDVIIKTGDDEEGIILGEHLTFTNTSSSIGGEDPEAIESAYRGYEKIKGTFNTLITVRDFENAIYNLHTTLQPLVSNCVVSDRVDDLETVYVQRSKGFYDIKERYDGTLGPGSLLNAFELRLRLLNSATVDGDEKQYESTYLPNPSVMPFVAQGIDELGEAHCAYDFVGVADKVPYVYKNMYTLDCSLLTTYKVSASESKEIITNVRAALCNAYNARELDFGEPIEYDDLINTILSADSRIKNVIMPEPAVNTLVVTNDGSEVPISNTVYTDGSYTYADLITAKSLLGGNTQYFDIVKDFQLDVGMENATPYNEIHTITTETMIKSGDTLREHENLQFIYPALVNTGEISYATYTLTNNTSNDVVIKDGERVALNENFGLKVSYTPSGGVRVNNQEITEPYVVFKGISDITVSSKSGDVPGTVTASLGAGQVIQRYDFNKVEGIGTGTLAGYRCYWITNTVEVDENGDTYYVLGTTAGTSPVDRVLDIGEYLIYVNAAGTTLNIMGSGTKVTLNSKLEDTITWKVKKAASYEDLLKNGAAEVDNNWQSLNENMYIDVQEMSIITYGAGSKLEEISPTSIDTIKNEFQPITGAKIIPAGSTKADELKFDNLQVRSRLNLSLTTDIPQTLSGTYSEDLYSGQSITITYRKNPKDTELTTVTIQEGKTGGPISVLANYSFSLTGGKGLDAYVYPPDASVNPGYLLKLLAYRGTAGTVTVTDSDGVSRIVKRETPGDAININLGKRASTGDLANISIALPSQLYVLLPVGLSTTYVSVTRKNVTTTSDVVTYRDSVSAEYDNLYQCWYTDSIGDTSIDKLTVKNTNTENELGVSIGMPVKTTLEFPDEFTSGVNTFVKGKNFNYIYEVPAADLVENPLEPESFWNASHPCNKYTIAQIDFDASNISIAKTSLR